MIVDVKCNFPNQHLCYQDIYIFKVDSHGVVFNIMESRNSNMVFSFFFSFFEGLNPTYPLPKRVGRQLQAKIFLNLAKSIECIGSCMLISSFLIIKMPGIKILHDYINMSSL